MRAWNVLVCLVVAAGAARSQSPTADFRRAEALEARTRGKVFRDRVEPNWLPGGDRFWYRVGLADGAQEFVLVDAAGGTRRPAFDHAAVADALTAATGKPVRPARLPFDRVELEADGKVRATVDDKGWLIDPATRSAEPGRKVRVADPPAPARRPGRADSPRGRPRADSPDGRWHVEVRDNDLWLRDRKSGETRPLTRDGTAADGYPSGDVYWAADSGHFVALRSRGGANKPVYLIESSPKDDVSRPKLHPLTYPKPGDPIDQVWPRLFDAASKSEVPVATDLFPNPWSVTELRWDADGKRFTFLYNERGHQTLRVLAVDAATGAARAVVEEKSKTFVDYAGKSFLHRLEPTNELIWMSERDGWNHLYLYDAATGRVKNRITAGEWVVRGVDRVDPDRRQVWFRACGVRPGQDPYHVHSCRVNFDGTGLVTLTEGDGTHEVRPSPDGRWLLDTYFRVDLPPVCELRRGDDGKLVCRLERADVSALEATGWRPPERFVAKGRDGTTDIHGVIHRPTFHDPAKKYPVIESIYAGPHGAFVPKQFSRFSPQQALAELGFVVVQIDGMGTNWRSKAFHDVCWKNLGDGGFPDRIAWMTAAAANDPSLDLTRVGINGGSAGGQSALRAVLAHGDFYKAAADCGCHDNRVNKIWWNELWMGWPVGPHYARQSNVSNARELRGRCCSRSGNSTGTSTRRRPCRW